MVRHHVGEDPTKLGEDEFATYLSEAMWLRQYDRELLEAAFTDSLRRVLGELFGKKRN